MKQEGRKEERIKYQRKYKKYINKHMIDRSKPNTNKNKKVYPLDFFFCQNDGLQIHEKDEL